MRIIIDERETAIYDKCQQILQTQIPPLTTITIEKKVLPIGDILFKTNDDQQTVSIIERKTIADLLASIKDGRYVEQSYRLANQTECPLHNIVYLIEGNTQSIGSYSEKRLVLSTMASVGFFKGFSVTRTGSQIETAEWIIWSADKIERNLQKRETLAHSCGEPNEYTTTATATPQNYCSVVKKVKKDNITRDNIGEIILCQIPGISSTTAIAIMAKYKTLVGLLDALKENPACLDGLQYESNGKNRKISKACIESIKQLLL